MLFDKGDGSGQNTERVYIIFSSNIEEIIDYHTHLILERMPSL